MQFVTCTEQDERDFNRFVAEQHSGSFLQSWQWGQLQHEYSNKTIYRFFVKDGEQILLAAQAIIMPLFSKQYYVYCPYGPVLAQEQNTAALQFFIKECRRMFRGAVFLRIEPKYNIRAGIGRKTINIQPGRTLLVNIAQPEEALLQSMHNKTRYNIKVAQRHGVEIRKEVVGDEAHTNFYTDAINLIVDTAKRQGYYTHPFEYYDAIINHFNQHRRSGDITVSIYAAYHQEALVATGLMVDFGKTRTYLFGGSSTEFRNIMAPYLLHYTAMIDAAKAGFTQYDFDGLEASVGTEAGFTRFKLGFGGSVIEYAGAYDIVRKNVVYTFYKLVRKINRFIKHMRY